MEDTTKNRVCVQCGYPGSFVTFDTMQCDWCQQYMHSNSGGDLMCSVWYQYDDDVKQKTYRVCRDCGYGEP